MNIQFISHHNTHYSYVDGIRMALEGGCRWIQLRMKEASDRDFLGVATVVLPLCRRYHATFILDDHVSLVHIVGADGVHLGREDMPVAEARRMLGNKAIIGGTANTFEDVERLCRSGVNYIGCGPYRFTTTKKKLSPVLGADGYCSIVSQMKSAHLVVPVVAIGGITSADVPEVMSTGVDGIAVSGAVMNADEPVGEMNRLIQEVIKYKVIQ